jgi:hypothetical protein
VIYDISQKFPFPTASIKTLQNRTASFLFSHMANIFQYPRRLGLTPKNGQGI